MRTFLLLLLTLTTSGFAYGQLTTFVPDDAFEGYLEANGLGDGIPNNDLVFTASIATLPDLPINNLGITDLEGIDDFLGLQTLDISDNPLVLTDNDLVLNNTDLNTIIARNCNIDGAFFNNLTQVNILDLGENEFTAISGLGGVPNLDVFIIDNSPLLTSINFQGANLIQQIQVSNSPSLASFVNLPTSNLAHIDMSQTAISSLDLSNAFSFNLLDAEDSQLTFLDLRNGNNTAITLDVRNNPLSCVNVSDVGYANSQIDVSWFKDANTFFALDCNGPTTNIPDPKFEQALIDRGIDTDLTINQRVFNSDIENVTLLNLTGNPGLETIPANIIRLDIDDLTGIEGFTNLQTLYAQGNDLTTIDLSSNTELIDVRAFNNDILQSINIDGLDKLRVLGLNNNVISGISVDTNTALEILDIANNQLSQLDLSGLGTLTGISVQGNNSLTCIQVANQTLADLYNANASGTYTKDPGAVFSIDCLFNIKVSLMGHPLVGGFYEITNGLVDFTLSFDAVDASDQQITSAELPNYAVILNTVPGPNPLNPAFGANPPVAGVNDFELVSDLQLDLTVNDTGVDVVGNTAPNDEIIDIVPDQLFEADEFFEIQISVNQSNISLMDADPDGVLRFPVRIRDVTEQANVNLELIQNGIEGPPGIVQNIEYRVKMSKINNTGEDIDFEVTVQDGTAMIGTNDYNVVTTTVSIPDGADEAPFVVTVLDDTEVEGTENLMATLSYTGTDYSSRLTIDGTPLEATITDDDSDTTLSFVTDPVQVNEDVGTAQITVRLTGAVAGGFTVDYATQDGLATAPDDYTTANGTLTFTGTDGEEQIITIDIIDDTDIGEGIHDFSVGLSNSSNGATTLPVQDATVEIADNDSASLSFVIDPIQVNEGAGTAQLTVRLIGAVPGGFTVDYATQDGLAIAPDDYTAANGTLTFAGTDGEEQVIMIDIIDDTDTGEGIHDFSVGLSNSSDGTITLPAQSATVEIADNDSATLSFVTDPLQVNEDVGTAQITVRLTGAVAGGFTVDYATQDGLAIAPDDYTSTNGTLTFAGTDGEEQIIMIDIIDDTDVGEGIHNFLVGLSNSSDGTITLPAQSATVEITDNDMPPDNTATLPVDAIRIEVVNPVCPNDTAGSLLVTNNSNVALDIIFTEGDNRVTVIGANSTSTIDKLGLGSYRLCFSSDQLSGFERCFGFNITPAEDIDAQGIGIDLNSKTADFLVKGSSSYSISLNGLEIDFNFVSSQEQLLKVPLKTGINQITIKGKSDCQGVVNKTIVYNDLRAYPNPVVDILNVNGILLEGDAKLVLINSSGQVISNRKVEIVNGQIELDMQTTSPGWYMLSIEQSEKEKLFVKIVKK